MDPKQNWRAPYLIEPGPTIRTRPIRLGTMGLDSLVQQFVLGPPLTGHKSKPMYGFQSHQFFLKGWNHTASDFLQYEQKHWNVYTECYSKTFRINSISYKIDSETPSANKDGTTVWSLNPISSKKKVWTLACPFLGNIIQGKVAYKELFILRQKTLLENRTTMMKHFRHKWFRIRHKICFMTNL